MLLNALQFCQRFCRSVVLALLLFSLLGLMPATALAGLNDDHYDGNIFALYAGNGSLVPPRVNLAQSFKAHKPAILVFYVDDSADCKQYSSVISQLQAPYGRAANFIPIMADSVPAQDSYEPTEPGYYFKGSVPQTLIFDEAGEVVFDAVGTVAYTTVDDALREVFNLLPRSQSIELKRRPVNEVNTELVNE
ncbi:MAG: thylakoid membrane photosystem I accumulation factor [Almyronema sp.]